MRYLAVLSLSCSLFAQVNVADLVKRSSENEERDWREAPHFVFEERDVNDKLDSDGRTKSKTVKTVEVMVLEGSEYRKVIAINDRPLSPEQQRAEDQKLAAERERRQTESASDRRKRVAKYERERQQDHLMMHEMVNAFNFKLVGEDTVNGRPCWVLDATPKPGYVPVNRDAKVLTGMRGKLWIDKADLQWAKVDAEVFRPVSFYAVATVSPGTRFTLEQKPVAAGIWQPSHFSVKVNSSILSVFARNSLDDEHYWNYRHAGENATSGGRAARAGH